MVATTTVVGTGAMRDLPATLVMIVDLQVVTESQHHVVVVAAVTMVDLTMMERDFLAANSEY